MLVVDDNHSFIEMTKFVLAAAGYRVETATDAGQALLQIAACLPDLILGDALGLRAAGSGLPLPCSIKRHGVSLANCDDEPVQTPGCIQGHGLLVALRPADLVVTQVSENCARWTGRSVEQLLGSPLATLVGEAAASCIQALMRTELLDNNPCYALTACLPGAPQGACALDMSIHTADGVLLLEMEPGGRGEPGTGQEGDCFAMVRRTIGRLKATRSLAEFCEVVAHEARRCTGPQPRPCQSGRRRSDDRRPNSRFKTP